jgi:hypothetical protein
MRPTSALFRDGNANVVVRLSTEPLLGALVVLAQKNPSEPDAGNHEDDTNIRAFATVKIRAELNDAEKAFGSSHILRSQLKLGLKFALLH